MDISGFIPQTSMPEIDPNVSAGAPSGADSAQWKQHLQDAMATGADTAPKRLYGLNMESLIELKGLIVAAGKEGSLTLEEQNNYLGLISKMAAKFDNTQSGSVTPQQQPPQGSTKEPGFPSIPGLPVGVTPADAGILAMNMMAASASSDSSGSGGVFSDTFSSTVSTEFGGGELFGSSATPETSGLSSLLPTDIGASTPDLAQVGASPEYISNVLTGRMMNYSPEDAISMANQAISKATDGAATNAPTQETPTIPAGIPVGGISSGVASIGEFLKDDTAIELEREKFARFKDLMANSARINSMSTEEMAGMADNFEVGERFFGMIDRLRDVV